MKNFFLNRKELKEQKNSENVPINPYEEIWSITWTVPDISITPNSFHPSIIYINPPAMPLVIPLVKPQACEFLFLSAQ